MYKTKLDHNPVSVTTYHKTKCFVIKNVSCIHALDMVLIPSMTVHLLNAH